MINWVLLRLTRGQKFSDINAPMSSFIFSVNARHLLERMPAAQPPALSTPSVRRLNELL